MARVITGWKTSIIIWKLKKKNQYSQIRNGYKRRGITVYSVKVRVLLTEVIKCILTSPWAKIGKIC